MPIPDATNVLDNFFAYLGSLEMYLFQIHFPSTEVNTQRPAAPSSTCGHPGHLR